MALDQSPFAWFVPYCPNFYFLPSLHYHKAFKVWDDGDWDCPAYWVSVGLPVIPCYETFCEAEAMFWISQDKYDRWDKKGGVHIKTVKYEGLWLEALNASRSVRKSTHMLKFDLHSPIDRGPVLGPPPAFRR